MKYVRSSSTRMNALILKENVITVYMVVHTNVLVYLIKRSDLNESNGNGSQSRCSGRG